MSAIARFFNHNHIAVAGYDRTPSPLTIELEAEGIAIHYEDNCALIPENIDLCVYTPAIPNDLGELADIRNRKIPLMKRSQVL